MPYLKITDTQPTPYSIEQLRQDNSNTSFPKILSDERLAEWGVYPYTLQDQPDYDPLTQKLKVGTFAEVNSVWTQGWVVSNRPIEDASNNIRSQRNNLLSQTDWMALSDNVMSPAWVEYRQSLRDVTAQEGFPFFVVWPSKPE